MEPGPKRENFLDWLDNFEYGLYKIPRPNKVSFLDVPLSVSAKLMEDRKNKYTNEDVKDIHERDMDYLSKTYDNAKYIANKFGWTQIDCTRNLEMKSIEEINDEIYKRVVEAVGE